MEIKNGVVLAGLDIKMRPVLIAAEQIWEANRHELVVTGGLEGVHSAGSLHYYGLALDLRHRYFSDDIKEWVAEELQRLIGSNYDVVIERTHIHVEYDPKG